MATAPPNNTENRSKDNAASTSFVLKTYFNPSPTASKFFFSTVRLAGFSFILKRLNNPIKMSVKITMNVPVT